MLTFTYVPESVSINVSYKEVINYFCYSTLHVFWTLTFSWLFLTLIPVAVQQLSNYFDCFYTSLAKYSLSHQIGFDELHV